MALQIVERHTVFDASQQPPESRVNAFTSVARLKSGELIVAFQSGPAKHAPTSTIRLCRSTDGGRTWQQNPFQFPTQFEGVPGSLSSADILETPSGELLLTTTWFDRRDPARPLFDAETQGVLHSRQLLSRSKDAGATWSPWERIPTGDLKGCAATGPSLQWSDGTIAHTFESFKEFDDPAPGFHAAWMAISHDGGKSFPQVHLVARHPENRLYYWDQRLCTGTAPGEYFALFWTHDLAAQKDLRVHFKHGSLQETGRPFDRVRETTIPGQIAAPLLLADRRLLAFVVDRNRPGTMTLWCSSDQGATWPESEKLVVHTQDARANVVEQTDQIDFNEYWDDMLKWSFGHPAIVDLRDGHVLCAWYAGSPGELGIHCARVKT